jgi:hypothetical protein
MSRLAVRMPEGDFFWNACRAYTAFSKRTCTPLDTRSHRATRRVPARQYQVPSTALPSAPSPRTARHRVRFPCPPGPPMGRRGSHASRSPPSAAASRRPPGCVARLDYSSFGIGFASGGHQSARVYGCTGARVHGCTGARVHGCGSARVPGCGGAGRAVRGARCEVRGRGAGCEVRSARCEVRGRRWRERTGESEAHQGPRCTVRGCRGARCGVRGAQSATCRRPDGMCRESSCARTLLVLR